MAASLADEQVVVDRSVQRSVAAGLVADGDQIIIRKGKCLKVLQARRSRVVFVERAKFKIDEIFGHPYGTQFEVRDGRLFVKKQGIVPDVAAAAAAAASGTASGGDSSAAVRCTADNRDLLASDDNQRLRREDVISLRKSGVQGEELVGQLIENSSTFAKKTEFSQEKWIRKKQAKHVTTMTVLRMSVRLLAQLYYDKDPMRVCYMRPDSLAQLLTYSGVCAGARPLIVETCQGLVVGAVLERLAGRGCAVQFFISDNPLKQRCALDDFAFTKDQLKRTLKLYPLCEVGQLRSRAAVPRGHDDSAGACGSAKASIGTDGGDSAAKRPRLGCDGSSAMKAAAAAADSGARDDDDEQPPPPDGADAAGPTTTTAAAAAGDCDPRQPCSDGACDGSSPAVDGGGSPGGGDGRPLVACPSWVAEREAVLTLVQQGNFDTLIVATRFHPTSIVLALLDFVAPSRPFVVYHQYLEPLSDCYQALRDRGGTVNLRLSETWLREQQVLPQRTHPMVTMNSSSGYLLTGTTVMRST